MSSLAQTKTKQLKYATYLASYLLIIWGFYRFLFKLPDEIEEFIVKPILWLIPVAILLYKEGSSVLSLGLTFKNLFPSLYYSLALGAVFAMEAMLVNYLKYGVFQFKANIGEAAFMTSFALTLATAFTEELTFRGYIFNRVWQALGSEWLANFATSIVWALVHLPVAVFVWKLNLVSTGSYILITTLFGLGASFVFARTRNILSPVILHIVWEWPIILFR